MNPLSPLTYCRRHKRQTLLLMGLISLMTLGVYVMVGLIDSMWKEMYDAQRHLTRASLVSALGPSLDAGVVSQIRTHPGVEHVIQERGMTIELTSLFFRPVRLFGVTEADMQVLMEAFGLRLKQGRLPQSQTNEMILSEEIVRAIDIQIGDRIGRSDGGSQAYDSFYGDVPAPLELVGILDGVGPEPHIRVGFASYEYVNSHELFDGSWASGLVVVAQEGHKETVDAFLESQVASLRTDVLTHRQLSEEVAGVAALAHLTFGVVDVVVAVAIALVVGIINQIAQARRLKELGLLHTVGYGKSRLLRRLTVEMAGIAVLSWGVGLALSWALFAWLQSNLYEPRGMSLDLLNLTAIGFSIPVPLTTTAFVVFGIARTFKRLDAVAIIERGKLSMEVDAQRQASRSSAKPLSSLTFYLRHRRRGLILIVAMGLMILGVSFPAFLIAPTGDAMKPFAEHLRQISVVTPRMGTAVDPGVTAQVRTHHPSVDRVIPAVLVPMRVTIPLGVWMINIYGVSESDLQTLVNLYDVQMKDGHLPRPHTNEIALSETAALNRGLSVGDKIGRPVNGSGGIPTEMVVVGIFSRPSRGRAENHLWLGFASYEYLSNHELYASHPTYLLVIPAQGHKDKVDAWLRQDVSSDLAGVQTLEWMQDRYRKQALTSLAVIGVLESIIAAVAAVALAVLSYTFFAQRQEEFGILHAMGRSRRWLVLRTIKETASAVAIAWLIGAVVCIAGLIYAQFNLYAPTGLSLNFFDPTPWLLTLPMPVAVVAVSAGLVALMFRRLDPVSVIERR